MTQEPRPQNPLLRISGVRSSQESPRTTLSEDIHSDKPGNKLVDDLPNSNDEDYDWRDEAACKGRSADMFPRSHKDLSYVSTARAICRSCPVKEPCLDFALSLPSTDMHGVWSGKTPRQLHAEQQRRGIKPEDIKPTLAAIWANFEAIERKQRRFYQD